ncbi:MAG: hypothetical protein GY899_16845 [Verrucomicrobiaceae bacterium]|nr:hypothetical protein [Verrucomicrobiaceae bacterium]
METHPEMLEEGLAAPVALAVATLVALAVATLVALAVATLVAHLKQAQAPLTSPNSADRQRLARNSHHSHSTPRGNGDNLWLFHHSY